jgi:hypothetical protein
MFFIFFLCIFTIFINYNFVSYNESLLLCIFFILFFILGYSLVKSIFKGFVFFKILKNFFLILLVLRLNNYFNKLLICFYNIKSNILIKLINRIVLLKKKGIVNINSLFNYYFIILYFIYYLNLNNKIRSKIALLNLNFFYFLKKIKNYDFFLFF